VPIDSNTRPQLGVTYFTSNNATANPQVRFGLDSTLFAWIRDTLVKEYSVQTVVIDPELQCGAGDAVLPVVWMIDRSHVMLPPDPPPPQPPPAFPQPPPVNTYNCEDPQAYGLVPNMPRAEEWTPAAEVTLATYRPNFLANIPHFQYPGRQQATANQRIVRDHIDPNIGWQGPHQQPVSLQGGVLLHPYRGIAPYFSSDATCADVYNALGRNATIEDRLNPVQRQDCWPSLRTAASWRPLVAPPADTSR
jgi:hypothetical protein